MNETGGKDSGLTMAWVLLSIPPVAGLLVFLMVLLLGRASLPTDQEIREAWPVSYRTGNEPPPEGRAWKEDLIQEYHRGVAHNRSARNVGLVVGALAAVAGYGVVGWVLLKGMSRAGSWREAVKKKEE